MFTFLISGIRIPDINNYLLISGIQLLISRIHCWYQEFIWWYQEFEFVISTIGIVDIKNYYCCNTALLISVIQLLITKIRIPDISKSISWYRKCVHIRDINNSYFWYQQLELLIIIIIIIIIERKDLGGVMSKRLQGHLTTLKTVTKRECDAKW